MKKTFYSLGFFIVLLLSVNAYTARVYDSKVGLKAPELRCSESDTACVELSDLKGRYVLLSFWSSTDAESRLAEREYDRMAADYDEVLLSRLSINFDRSQSLFREILRIDRLNETTRYHVNGSEATKIRSAYGLSEGFKTFLIDPEGRIVAMNPSEKILTKMLSNQ